MKRYLRLAILGATFTLGACVQDSLYEWGKYDETLLAYYKDASHIDAFEAELFALIEQQGAKSDKPLPPGIYAEYGYLQMQKGDVESAIKFFELEKKHWPESKILMETMIRVASGKRGGQDKAQAEKKEEGKSHES